MKYKSTNFNNAVNWIGVCTAIGVAFYASTNEPTWIAVGVAIGAALGIRKPKSQHNSEIENKNG